MSQPLRIESVDAMPRTPASEVKKIGWRGVMKSLQRTGNLVVTNHNEPQAIILSIEAYGAILQAVDSAGTGTGSALDALRREFDTRMAVLDEADAGIRLRKLMEMPTSLAGEVKAGDKY